MYILVLQPLLLLQCVSSVEIERLFRFTRFLPKRKRIWKMSEKIIDGKCCDEEMLSEIGREYV